MYTPCVITLAVNSASLSRRGSAREKWAATCVERPEPNSRICRGLSRSTRFTRNLNASGAIAHLFGDGVIWRQECFSLSALSNLVENGFVGNSESFAECRCTSNHRLELLVLVTQRDGQAENLRRSHIGRVNREKDRRLLATNE